MALNNWKGKVDPIAAFVEECCELEPNGWISKRELYAAYEAWVGRGNSNSLHGKTVFLRTFQARYRLEEHREAGTGARGLSGIKMKQ